MLKDWSHKDRAILKEYCSGNIKNYCPPCHKAGIHDFILAIKSSVWIIICSKRGKGTTCRTDIAVLLNITWSGLNF